MDWEIDMPSGNGGTCEKDTITLGNDVPRTEVLAG